MGKAASSPRSNLKREILGISLLALAALVALSLFSFNPDDVSLNNQPSAPQKTANLAGLAGSYLSDIFFQIFGLTGFLWPLILGFLGLKLIRNPEISLPPWKVISWMGLFLAINGLLSLGLGQVSILGGIFDSGGVLGRIIANTGERFLNPAGAALVLALALVVCMMVITNLSWMEVSQGAGQLYFSTLQKWQDFLKAR
ncbi:MAG: DNA translocase FtsK 4TM domain-containing protein, partial [Planctomycetaceae bacterium]